MRSQQMLAVQRIESYLGYRLTWESLLSSRTTRQSVLRSSERGNWFKNACSAAWMASALSIPLDLRASKIEVGRSIQNPVVSRSHGGVSRSTASSIVLCLSRYGKVNNTWRFLEDIATSLILKNPGAGNSQYLTTRTSIIKPTKNSDTNFDPWLTIRLWVAFSCDLEHTSKIYIHLLEFLHTICLERFNVSCRKYQTI